MQININKQELLAEQLKEPNTDLNETIKSLKQLESEIMQIKESLNKALFYLGTINSDSFSVEDNKFCYDLNVKLTKLEQKLIEIDNIIELANNGTILLKKTCACCNEKITEYYTHNELEYCEFCFKEMFKKQKIGGDSNEELSSSF